jgi:TfoX/Sxy family transcriptional regulator of competence genes
MPYSEAIERRIDGLVRAWDNVEKKRMFGGICYLLNGNICFGIYRDYLIVRCGVDAAAEKLQERHVKPMDITGKPMKGWLMVEEGGWKRDEEMDSWLQLGRRFALTLPPK